MKVHKSSIHIAWDTLEYTYVKNHPDWFWGIGLISVVGMVISFMTGNMLFFVIVAIATFLIVVFSLRKPDMVHIEISDQGILMDDIMHPFSEFKWFWLFEDKEGEAKLIIHSDKTMFSTATIPISKGVEINQLRTLLKGLIEEHEINEPFFHKLLDKMGF